MFTVCPKCALTLVVTAADLRVAQGYVRCGRCSNVFNALARLSEDRNAAAAAAASQGVPPSSTGVHPRPQPTAVPSPTPQPSPTPARPPPATGSFTFTRLPDTPAPTARAPQQTGTPGSAQGTGSAAQPPDTNAATARSSPPPAAPLTRPQQAVGTPPRPHQASGAPTWPQQAPPSAAPPSPSRLAPPAPPPPLELDDDDAIPEDALEFNPDADVNQVFVEPPPNPEWTAATGTFKAIVLKSEEVIHGPAPLAPTPAPAAAQSGVSHSAAGAANRAGATSRAGSTRQNAADPSSMSRGSIGSSSTSQDSPTFDSLDLSSPEPASLGASPIGLSGSFGDDEFELDPDFLSATAEMRKLKTGLGDPDTGVPAEAPLPLSARLAPRGPLPDEPTQSQFRTSPTETPSQTQFRASGADVQSHPRSAPSDAAAPARASPAEAKSRQQLKPPPPAPLDTETFFEPQVVSSRPPTRTAAVKAFGLDAAAEPPPERLATLARSRVAPSGVELETAPPATRTLPNVATLWSAGSGALVILLAAQIVNHYRNDLAATAQFNKPITALYAALGVHLTPRWDLHAYDVRQLGASVDSASAGQIMVRASVKNGAHQPQPMPLLRVTLQDRFGNRIAARDVPPGSYLPRATADTAFLPAGQRIDAEMAFVDPGSNAVGFEIDACLPAPAGGIACANDPASR
jgi:predicted Zn finger-like uncharacterized protein